MGVGISHWITTHKNTLFLGLISVVRISDFRIHLSNKDRGVCINHFQPTQRVHSLFDPKIKLAT